MANDKKHWMGEIGPYHYDAREKLDEYKPNYIMAYIYKGEKLLRSQMPGTSKTRLRHTFASVEDLRRFLYHKVRRRRVPQDNTVDSHPQWRKRLEKRRERRERWREPEVKTEHYDGKAHHRIV